MAGREPGRFRPDRLATGRQWGRRGREVGLGRLRGHTNNLIFELMFVTLGVIFIVYKDTSALSGLYEPREATDAVFAAEQWTTRLAQSLPVVAAALVAVGAVLVSFLAYRVLSGRSTATFKGRPRGGGDRGEQVGSR